MINPKALEEIKKIKTSERIDISCSEGAVIVFGVECVGVHVGKPWYSKKFKVTIKWSAGGAISIDDTKEFHGNMKEIISIAEQCKAILKKYKQYEEKKK